MKTISFKIETITPMFLSGADQGKAELRAASIKGLLRYWWRALQAESDLGELRKKESKIFGSSGEKIEGSSFSIRVSRSNKQPLPNFKKEVQGMSDPVGYLFYSTFMQKGKERPYFHAESKFTVTLSSSSRDEKSLKIASASFWALVYLGGLGTRARRGAGNITVNRIEDTHGILNDIGLDFIPEGSNSVEVAEWLIDNFESARRVINKNKTMFISEYSNLSFSRFRISNAGHATWKKALGEIGETYKGFRRGKQELNKAVFGLPVENTKGRIGNGPIERRSSPLIFKLIKVNNQYYWLALRLAGEFLPEGGLIAERNRTQKPDYGIIDEFWTELKNKGKEYILSVPDTLSPLIEGIKQEVDPKKIILFGSKARGDFHSQSDTDIAVDTEKPLANLSLLGAADIVSFRKTDEKLKEKIEKEGVVIYERKG